MIKIEPIPGIELSPTVNTENGAIILHRFKRDQTLLFTVVPYEKQNAVTLLINEGDLRALRDATNVFLGEP